jgi:hypothetical protein
LAFRDFDELFVGRGMDEESLSSSFFAALSIATRHLGALPTQGDDRVPPISQIHYRKKAETVVGADFALIIPAFGRADRFRVALFQAKNAPEATGTVTDVDVRREPRWHSNHHEMHGYEQIDDLSDGEGDALNHEPPADAERAKALAKAKKREHRREGDSTLREVYDLVANNGALPDDAIARLRRTTQWQLTKLLLTEMQLRRINPSKDAAAVYYAVWPLVGGALPRIAHVTGVRLDRDSSSIAGSAPPDDGDSESKEKYKPCPQRLPATAQDRDLRSFLIDAATEGGGEWLSLDEAARAFKVLTPVSAVAILDLGHVGAGAALEAQINANLDAGNAPSSKAAADREANVASGSEAEQKRLQITPLRMSSPFPRPQYKPPGTPKHKS